MEKPEINKKMGKHCETVAEFLDYLVFEYGDLDPGFDHAYEWLEDGKIVARTYGDLRDDSFRMAFCIRQMHGTGRHFALIGSLSYEFMCLFYGIIISGNVAVPMDVKVHADAMAQRLDYADIDYAFVAEDCRHFTDTVQKKVPHLKMLYGMKEYFAIWAGHTAGQDAAEETDPEQLSVMLFTSGTAGDGFKVVMYSQKNVMAMVRAYLDLCMPNDRMLSVLPISHCYELFCGNMCVLYQGGTICINDDLKHMIRNFTLFRITDICAVPAMAKLFVALAYQALQKGSVGEAQKVFGGQFHHMNIGGAQVSTEVLEVMTQIGVHVVGGYGLTETGGGFIGNNFMHQFPEAVGRDCYVKGTHVKLLEDGELCVQGPSVMMGYYKNQELTARVLQDGWLHTGDIFEYGPADYLIMKGRKDNMINLSGGEKIYPENWEDKLMKLPGVRACLVCAIEDHLAAVFYTDKEAEPVRDAIREAVNRLNLDVPDYAKISDVRFRMQPFPMTSSMKIIRKEAMKEILAESSAVHVRPHNVTEEFLLQAVRTYLPGVQVGVDDNLFACGLDSLGVLGLSVDLSCEPVVIYTAKTIRHLANSLNGVAADQLHLHKKKQGMNALVVSDIHTPFRDPVLVTGGSGYLAGHLIHRLLERGHRVICLVRDPKSYEESCFYYGFVHSHRHLQVVKGNVALPRFGLSDADYQALCEKVSSVMHVAALVSHVGHFARFYAANVEGTAHVIAFCKEAGAILYHMSSYAVSGFHPKQVLTEQVLDVGQDIDKNPYINTKYQAEELVFAARQDGLESTVFRIGNLVSRQSDGCFQKNPEQSGILSQMHGFEALRVYPESMQETQYDMTSVDEAADAICRLAESEGTGHVWHIMNPYGKTIHDILPVYPVSDQTFAALLAANKEKQDVCILAFYYQLIQHGFTGSISLDATVEKLKELGFVWTKR